ncbi:MAG TPA: DUF4157 domain-containing protein [Pyrinomonadaceae bacterium]|nr:DUF4157 domain-containing protein [Pyrinomonadaceae bacterium]
MIRQSVINHNQHSASNSWFVPGLLLQRKCACGQHTIGGGECSACSGEKTTLQRQVSSNTSANSVPGSAHEVLSTSGEPLNPSVRSFMESGFAHALGDMQVSSATPQGGSSSVTIGPAGDRFEQEADRTANAVMRSASSATSFPTSRGTRADFSQVRVHADEAAARSAEDIGALAFTAGTHIVFGPGEFAPETSKGRQLLAHELTHVMQQGGRGFSIQRKEKEKTPCAVHAYDNSNPKDTAVIPKKGGVGVGSVPDLVSKVNAYVDDPKNSCSCVNRLEINGHGTDGYQSVGNGDKYVPDDKALIHDSPEEHLKQMATIKFCSRGLLMLMGCHVGHGKGKTLLSRLSAILPGKMIGGAQHYTAGTGMGEKRVVGAGDLLDKKGNIDWDKADPFLTSPFVRWHVTIDGKEYVINGTEATSSEGKAKLRAGENVKLKTPEGEVRIK